MRRSWRMEFVPVLFRFDERGVIRLLGATGCRSVCFDPRQRASE